MQRLVVVELELQPSGSVSDQVITACDPELARRPDVAEAAVRADSLAAGADAPLDSMESLWL